MSEKKSLKEKIKYTGTWNALYTICDAISELEKQIVELKYDFDNQKK